MRLSPKDSATLYKKGDKKKGEDGNMWIITITKSGIKRWSKYDDAKDILYKKLYKWWLNFSNGGILIIYKNGRHKMYKGLFKSTKARYKDIEKKHIEYSEDPDVVAIIWSGISFDGFEQFRDYIIRSKSKTELNKMLKHKSLPEYIIKNYKKFFRKYELRTKKDYTFKY